jgi:hypothetical protein
VASQHTPDGRLLTKTEGVETEVLTKCSIQIGRLGNRHRINGNQSRGFDATLYWVKQGVVGDVAQKAFGFAGNASYLLDFGFQSSQPTLDAG